MPKDIVVWKALFISFLTKLSMGVQATNPNSAQFKAAESIIKRVIKGEIMWCNT